jgi:hypothetical protein
MGGGGETEHGELGVSCKSNNGEVAHPNFCPSSIYSFRVVCHSGDICKRLDLHHGHCPDAASTIHWLVENEERQ